MPTDYCKICEKFYKFSLELNLDSFGFKIMSKDLTKRDCYAIRFSVNHRIQESFLNRFGVIKMRKTITGILLSTILIINISRADNIFTEYLTDEPPEIVETVSKTVEDGIEITKLKFLSREVKSGPYAGEKVIIYGILTRPAKEGKYPGMLVCHGGGGYADYMEESVVGWAKRGYVSFCQDQPSWCSATRTKSSGSWRKHKWNEFVVEGDPISCRVYDGVASALNGLRLLRSQPDVDKSTIGVTGGSMGGYMTTMVAGLAGERVKAAFSVYGCGYFDLGTAFSVTLDAMGEEERELWLKYLDAGRYASNIKGAYFLTVPTNDWWFWPPAMGVTYEKAKGPKRICFSPNDSHQLKIPGGTGGPQKINRKANRTYMEIVWMDYHLKGEGKAFAACQVEPWIEHLGNYAKVRFKVDSAVPVKSVTVWYCDARVPWRLKWWEQAEINYEGGDVYSALVPVYNELRHVDWFGLATDERDITVSTTMQLINPVTVGNGRWERRKWYFEEDFETKERSQRWRRPYASKSEGGEYKICATAAHEGELGLEIKGKVVLRCDGLWGKNLKQFSRGLSLWAKSPGGTGFDVLLMAEASNGRRYFWKAGVENPDGGWKKIEVRWHEFKFCGASNSYAGMKPSEPPKFEMLGDQLGQLRLATPVGAEIYIDDISSIRK